MHCMGGISFVKSRANVLQPGDFGAFEELVGLGLNALAIDEPQARLDPTWATSYHPMPIAVSKPGTQNTAWLRLVVYQSYANVNVTKTARADHVLWTMEGVVPCHAMPCLPEAEARGKRQRSAVDLTAACDAA